ncbi:YqaE/Pmp3 family membrane protein [Candidatus Pelagisphaera phototrophica]
MLFSSLPVGTFLQVGTTKHLWINIVLLFLTLGVGALTKAL